MNPTVKQLKLELFCLRFSAHALAILFAIGWVGFARFVPAPSPLSSAATITQMYVNNRAGIQIGVSVMMVSFGLWAPWGSVVAAWTRRMELGTPVLTYIQIVSMSIAEFVGCLCAFFWGVASYRAGDVSTDITLTLNDMGWLMFLIPWPPFSAWCLAMGVAILRDESSVPVFPRWAAGLCFLSAFLFMPALLPLFFKSTGFAYNGLLGMYIPLLIFFIWIEGMTYGIARAIKQRILSQQSDAFANSVVRPANV